MAASPIDGDSVADSRRAHRGLRRHRAAQATAGARLQPALSIGSLSFSLLLSLVAFATRRQRMGAWRVRPRDRQLHLASVGAATVDLGWVLDPLSAIMLVMVSFVGLLIFIYSTGYMAHDENFTRFFCFLSLFAGAMLGVVISNSLLLLFMSWELVGPHVVPADRLLVSEALGRSGSEKSLPHHARRRRVLSSRHRLAVRADGHAALL